MSQPEFSIIMPAWNCEDTVAESIESVLAQSHHDFELLVVDDCSTDNTKVILQDYTARDVRIIVLRQPNNHGVAYARNIGIRAARGRYIAFLDSDDLWLPDKLKIQKEYLENGHAVVYSSYTRFGTGMIEKRVDVPTYIDYESLLHGNVIANLTGVYDAKRLGKIYQKPIHHEDYLMWLEIIALSGQGTGIQIALARYRVRSGSISSSKIRSGFWTWTLYRRHLRLSLLKSLKNFLWYIFQGLIKRI